jgi:signal peptidase I
MEHTILVGDHLLINRVAYRWKQIRRGDVVSFRAPNKRDAVYLKRVIARGGDRVEFREDALFVNGAPVAESYVQHVCRACGEHGRSLVVPRGQLYVLGDNRDRSEDSRYWGTVPEESVVGAPVMVLWSFAYPSDAWLRGTPLALYLNHPLARLRWSRFMQSVQ